MNARIVFAAVLLASSFALASEASLTPTSIFLGGVLQVNNQSFYSPYPAEPGRYVDVWIRVSNMASASRSVTSSVDNIACAVEPTYPFSIDPDQPVEQGVGSLSPYQDALLKYRLRVAEDAVEGNNELTFKCKSSQYPAWSTVKFNVYVQPHDAVLSVENVETDPAKLSPGESGKIIIHLKNSALTTVKDISVKLDMSSTTLPFAPTAGTTERRVLSITPGKEEVAEIPVIVFPTAENGVYKIPLALTYSDSLGKAYSSDSTLAVEVYSKPDLLVTLDKSTIVRSLTRGKITIAITNRGLSKVKFVSIKLNPSDQYEIISVPELYVGNIDSDDFETVEYDLFVNSTTGKTIPLPVTLSYKDSVNKDYTETRTLELPLYTKEEASLLQIEGAGGWSPLLLFIGGGVLAYLLYRFVIRRKG